MALTIRLTPGRVLAVGDIITEDILNDLANPTVELEGSVSTTTIADNSITLAKLIVGILTADAAGRSRMVDEFVTAAKLNATQDWTGKTLTGTPTVNWGSAVLTPPAGFVVQEEHSSSAAFSTIAAATPAGTIPIDDTVPQSNEGTDQASLQTTITPKSATNILEIEVYFPVLAVTALSNVAAALFQDATVNSLTATAVVVTAGAELQLLLRHRMVAGTTSATTFKVRLGVDTGSLYVNGKLGARLFGGVAVARMIIHELTA